ncbi:MAG: hypothetical protein E6G08_05845 [Actinobacteria bacterium]|nr:MAG: hypothetical protein E6G08_05845 [Actinomycetota bacterium]
MSAEDSLSRAEELLARLEATRGELERLAEANDADKALEVLGELSELAKEVEEELEKARRAGEADANA